MPDRTLPLVEVYDRSVELRCVCGHVGHLRVAEVMRAYPGLETLGDALENARCAACGHEGALSWTLLPAGEVDEGSNRPAG